MVLSLPVFGQVNKATRLFDSGAFSQAARLYERVLEKDSTSRIAINNLAHCYRQEKRYREARELFRETLSFSSSTSSNYYHYAEMHYLLGEYKLARNALENYLEVLPGDPAAAKLLAWINDVEQFPEQKEFELIKLSGINSPFADFAPVVHNAGLVFTTERKEHSGNEEFAIENRPFTNIYYAPFSNQRQTSFWTPRTFAKNLTSRFHDGPACFNSKGDEIYFTQVEREFSGEKVNTMKIYVSRLDGEKWTDPELLPFNSNDYSVAHPALSTDNRTLLFSSDMPGGEGGMDLYMCRKVNNQWSVPVNLGPNINSEGDEVFPHFREGAVYFSSNGWPGYGGLDLFVAHIDSLENAPRNLYAPVNSAWDDLSISYLDNHKAYFSSDRPGGMGRDDIYGLHRVADEKTHREISGILEYEDKPAPHASLKLKDQDGKVLQKTVTNDEGRFSLDFIKASIPYFLSLDIDQKDQLEKFSIFLLNSNNEKVQEIKSGESGDFKFELLPPDDFDNLELLEVEDVSLLSIDIHGQVFENEPGDFSDRIEIVVVDAKGEILNRTYTRRDGQFIFKNLFPDDQYIFRILADNPGLKISILDEQGNVLHTLTGKGMEFIYNRLDPDEPILQLLNERNLTIKISPDDRFAIPNIYYDLDSYELNDNARNQLEKLVVILKKNPDIGVNVMSHTDSRASDQYNLRLSEKRADRVVSFLKSKGIDDSRVSGKGYGEKQLVNHCKNEVACSEEEHARNRRTEFSLYTH